MQKGKKQKKGREKTDAEINEMFDQLMDQSDDFREVKPNGAVNWTTQFVEARGETVIDTVRFKNKTQARAMAIRGAVVVAQRNLLEIINGVKIFGETTVEDMITTNDYIYSRVDGIIKGAEMVGEPYEEYGMMVVRLKAPLYQKNGLASAVYDETEELKLKSGETPVMKVAEIDEENIEEFRNFIFDLGNKNFDPSLFPVIIDEQNIVLLDLYKLYDPNVGEFPEILKASRELLDSFGFSKGVEVIDVIDSFDGKLVVSDVAKKKINWEKIASTISTVGKVLMMFI
jgi:hypothetical protein